VKYGGDLALQRDDPPVAIGDQRVEVLADGLDLCWPFTPSGSRVWHSHPQTATNSYRIE